MRIEREPELGSLGQRPLEDEARVGKARRAVGQHDVAEHPCSSWVLATPGQHLERPWVGLDQHVGLVDPGKALDGAAVEADALGEGALQLRGGYGHRLQLAQDVGEPEPHEADVAFLDGA